MGWELDLKPHILDHPMRFRCRLTRSREIAVYKQGIRRVESQRLKRAEIVFTTAADPDLGPGI